MQKTIKKILSFCMVLAMLLTLLPAMQLFPAANAASSQTVKIYFKNSDNWSKVYGYVWDASGSQLLGTWPGTALTANSLGLYELTVSYTPTGSSKLNFIFNNNSGDQTADLSLSDAQITSGVTYWVNGKAGTPVKYAVPTTSNGLTTFTYESSASSVYVAGSFNGWSMQKMTKSGTQHTYTVALTPGTYEYKYVENGSSWVSDPYNPVTTGTDNNSVLVVTGLFNATATAVKGQASTLPSELNYLDASGNTVKKAVTYSSTNSAVSISGNTVTVSKSYTGSTLDLTATAADGSTATVTVTLKESASDTTGTVRIHFYNNLGWSGVCAYPWAITGTTSSSIGDWAWPGSVVQLDSDGYNTLVLDYVPTSGQDLGVLFHNHNGSQTADITISYAQLSASTEFWIEPSLTADDSGKYPCTLRTTESSVFKSHEVNGNQVTFRYKGSATSVYVAGSFNGWSKTANKLTKGTDGVYSCTVTLDAGVHEYKFIVSGSWTTDPANGLVSGYDGNNIVVVPTGNTAAENTVTVKFHYYREDGVYTGWDLWTWGSYGDKAVTFEADTVNKGVVATFTVDSRTNLNVGYIVRKTDWSDKEKDYNRYIDLSDVAAGTVHYYLNSGSDTGNRVLDADIVTGGKIVSANLAYDTGRIWVKTSLPLSSVSTAFSVVGKSGNAVSDLSVTSVGEENGQYVLTLNKSMTLKDTTLYLIKCNGCTAEIGTEGLFYSSAFRSDYHYNGDDLGAVWSKNATTFKVWAPTAKNVQVLRYKGGNYGGNDWIETVDMTMGEQGVWSATVSGDLNGTYYTYLVTFPTYNVETADPYSVAVGANGDRSMVLDLDSTDPEGWESDISPNRGMKYTDAIIYEMHIREMTIDSSSGVKDAWKGTYLGLTQTGTTYQGRATALDHLKELGITHVQLMPAYDFASNDEYHLEDWEQYAWGYDPEHYNVPEGSYSTDPYNGEVRVNEFKQMVQSFHKNGINVVMDVVYNHTFSGGDWCYNKIVPNYFSRFWGDGSWSNGSGCGNDLATEREMARKYIVDSIMHWVEEYHIDGFRFDLAGLIDTQTINEITSTVHAKYPYVIFYGEGWGVGDTAVEPGYSLATKGNACITGSMAFYNDDFRNDIAGNNGGSWGFATGDWGKADAIGNYFRASNGWSGSPSQTINYVSSHDNYSLIDKIIISRDGASWDEMVRMNNLSASIYMLAQGIPRMYSGEELLREKKNEDGYRIDNAHGTNDYVNKLRWSDLVDKTNAQMTDDYYAGLIEFRKNHSALRNPGGEDAWNYTTYHKINDQCVLFYINGYPNWECSDGIVVIYNASTSTQWIDLYNYGIPHGYWQAAIHGTQAGNTALWGVDVGSNTGSVGVEGISATVLVLGDMVDENSVYNQQKQYLECTHASHNTSGLCTSCGVTVVHSYVSGACSVCGLSEAAPETVTVYYDNTGSNWSSVNIYSWTTVGDNSVLYSGAWPGSAMTHVSGNIYAYTLPIGATNVIFNDGTNQTDDLTAPAWDSSLTQFDSASQKWVAPNISCDHASHDTDGICTNCFQSVAHSYTDGVCSVCGGADPDYVPTVDYYLFGYINGANYACEEDYENMGIYKFADGKLVATFDSDSYVAVKTGNNAAWYMTDGWLGTDATSATLYNTDDGIDANKLFVPGGVEITFTLTANSDGTLTLSYAAAACDHSYTEQITTAPGCETAGVKTFTCSKCGDSYTEEIAAAGHSYENGTCTVCGAADPDYTEPSVIPTIKLNRGSATFEDEVYFSIYTTITDVDDIVFVGLLVSEDDVVDENDEYITDYEAKISGSTYVVRSHGIPAKELNESVYFKVYALLSDGTYAYSRQYHYCPYDYAIDRLKNSTDAKLKALCVAMLNYGAAAQTYFGYNTENLANATLTDEQKALVSAYDSTMVNGVTAADSAKIGEFANTKGYSSRKPSVSFEGAFSISYYLTPKTENTPENGVTLYYWTKETYDSVDVLTRENADGVITTELSGTAYKGTVAGIAAKEIDQPIYAAGVYEYNGTSYATGVMVYSLGAYCVDRINNGSAEMKPLAEATAVYGYYAKQYFAA